MDFFAGGFRAATLRAGARLAVVLRPAALRAGARLADAFLVVAFLVATFFAVAFLTVLVGAGTGARPFTTSLKTLPGANRTPFAAATFTGSPVRGFRPSRAFRWLGLKAPNPVIATFLPAFTSLITAWITAFTAASPSAAGNAHAVADLVDQVGLVHRISQPFLRSLEAMACVVGLGQLKNHTPRVTFVTTSVSLLGIVGGDTCFPASDQRTE